MKILRALSELRELTEPVHWAVGFFDGVHPGHQRVIRSARVPGAMCGVLTFRRHPLSVLRPGSEPLLLTPRLQQKAALLRETCGADVLLLLPFDRELAGLSPEAFLEMLCRSSRTVGISVGENWHFGCGGRGDADFLRREGKRRGLAVRIQPLVMQGGAPICSGRVRAELAAGHLGSVRRLLGRAFSLAGTVVHGQHLAARLGFPTANISPARGAALPPAGVYAVECRVGGVLRRGIANLGLRPTVVKHAATPMLEVHFPGIEADLYRRFLTVEFLRFMRPERRFDSAESLREQVMRDIDALRAAFSLSPQQHPR